MERKLVGTALVVVGLVVGLVMAVVVGSVVAQEPQPFESPLAGEEWPPVPPVGVEGVEDYVAAVGIGGIITVVVEILKQVGAIPDGQAGRWATLANIVAFAVLAVVGVFGVDFTGDTATAIYDLLERIGQAVLMVMSSPIVFRVMRGAEVFRPLGDRWG